MPKPKAASKRKATSEPEATTESEATTEPTDESAKLSRSFGRPAALGVTLVQGAFGLLLGILVLASWPSSGKYVIGCFLSLALRFDGPGLVATGFGGRRMVSLVSDRTRTTRRVRESAQDGQDPSHD